MFRHPYDYDVTVWSPQGRLYQVEYAKEAVKCGASSVGLKSCTHAALVSLKRATSDLAAFQKKIIEIEHNMGISYSGLTADVKVLANYLRNECLSYKYSQNTTIPSGRLMERLAKKMHLATQKYNQRPFGVGLLLAAYDSLGPRIFEACPSGTFFNCKAMAIGGRCQSARTYLEKNLTKFPNSDLETLIKHGLKALQCTLPNNVYLTSMNVAIGVVGSQEEFSLFSDEEVYDHLQLIDDHQPECGDFSGQRYDDAQI